MKLIFFWMNDSLSSVKNNNLFKEKKKIQTLKRKKEKQPTVVCKRPLCKPIGILKLWSQIVMDVVWWLHWDVKQNNW